MFTLLVVAVALTLATKEKRFRGYIGMRVEFKMEHHLGNIKPHENKLKEAIHLHMMRKLKLEHNFIKNMQVRPEGSLIIVQFEAYHGGKYDVKLMLTKYKVSLQKHICGIRYNGHTMHPRYESFKMGEIHDHHNKGHEGWWAKCKKNKMYLYGGGMILILLIVVVAVAVTVTCVCVRKRRCAAIKAKGANFKQNLTMDNPYVVMPEEKKVPLA